MLPPSKESEITPENVMNRFNEYIHQLAEEKDIEETALNKLLYQAKMCLESLDQLFKSDLKDKTFSQELYQKISLLDSENPALNEIKQLYFRTIGTTYLWKNPPLVVRDDYLANGNPYYFHFKYIYKALMQLAKFPSFIFRLPSTVNSLYKDTFIDGDSPWKREKYALNLQAMQIAFQKANIDLEAFKEELQQKDSRSDLENKAIEVIDLLTSKSTENKRSVYRSFIYKLREALLCTEFLSEIKKEERLSSCATFFLLVCSYRYTEVHIYPFCQEVVETFIKEGFDELIKKEPNAKQYQNIHPLDLPLDFQFECIRAAPQNNKAPRIDLFLNAIEGGTGRFFDPQAKSNMPYTLYDFTLEGRTIRVMRFGTPTNQNYCGEAKINPEFKHFLHKKKVLYIRLEDEQKNYIVNEWIRNEALKELNEEYPENFFLSIFSLDNSFFYQKDEYADNSLGTSPFETVEAYKESFMKAILGKGFYFNPTWSNETSFNDKLENIWDEVHEIFFDKKYPLNQVERGHFVIAYYVLTTFYLLRKSQADYFLFGCKDSADRGQMLQAVLLSVLLIFMNKELSTKHLRFLKVVIHAAALIVRKREMNERRDRLISFLEFIFSSEQIRERLRERKEYYGVNGEDIFVPTIEEDLCKMT